MIRGGGDFLLKLVARDTGHENQLTQRLTGSATVATAGSSQTFGTAQFFQAAPGGAPSQTFAGLAPQATPGVNIGGYNPVLNAAIQQNPALATFPLGQSQSQLADYLVALGQAIGQLYIDLAVASHDLKLLDPLIKEETALLGQLEHFDPEIANPNHSKNPATIKLEPIPWWWCDALFMAPPVWAKMFKATGDRRYLDYMHLNWKRTYDLLYDKDEHLYARDASYKDKREPNGKKIFWSRGEGWVMGGLARVLDDIPADDPRRGFYVQQLREMSDKIASLQGSDGLWHAGLLDPQTYPLPEISGSALFVYGMAYGVNHGLLDGAKFRPVIAKAWAGILKNVYADGRVGNIQQTGAEPAFYRPTSSFDYGVGGFMLAAAELKRMAQGGTR